LILDVNEAVLSTLPSSHVIRVALKSAQFTTMYLYLLDFFTGPSPFPCLFSSSKHVKYVKNINCRPHLLGRPLFPFFLACFSVLLTPVWVRILLGPFQILTFHQLFSSCLWVRSRSSRWSFYCITVSSGLKFPNESLTI
jgi:hypothetical protein